MEKDPVLITAYSLSEFYAAQQSPQPIQPSQAKAPAGGAAALPSSLASRAAIAMPPTAAMTPATTTILIFLRMEVPLSWMQDSGPSEALCRNLCGG